MKPIYLIMALSAATFITNAQQLNLRKTENQVSSFAGVTISGAISASSQTLVPSTFETGGCATNTTNVVFYSMAQYTATPTYTIDAKGYSYGTNLTYLTRGGTTYTISTNRAAQKYFVTGFMRTFYFVYFFLYLRLIMLF